jgi:diguanylate cyclase (GGDEF)-like protein
MATEPRKALAKTVLIIDDSRTIRRILRDALQAQGLFEEYLEAGDGQAGLEVAQTTPVDLVLCDLDMPRLDGFGFLKGFLATDANRRVPVLMLTGSDEAEKKVEGFALGAIDYIVKPCHPTELCARVRNYLRLKLLQDELETKNRELESKNVELAALAVTDPLTQLHNRRYFMTRSDEELRRSQRYGGPFTILLLDVDHFKKVNDTHGHQVGDDVLVAVARRLRSTLRSTDVLARYGGEEFVVGLPETSVDGARAIAERLRASIEAEIVPAMGRAVTASIGVATLLPDTPSVVAMLESADAALYSAKRAGRNRVEIAAIPADSSGAAADDGAQLPASGVVGGVGQNVAASAPRVSSTPGALPGLGQRERAALRK